MNREIKFRYYDPSIKAMLSPSYVGEYGVYIEDRDVEDGQSLPFDGLMQFTGLHDVNGKEIYENDILSPTPKREISGEPLKKKPNNKNKTVIFHEGAFKISSGPDKGRHSLTGLMIRTMGYVVTGNSFENPELLTP